MARATIDDVLAIADFDGLSASELQAFIEDASAHVDTKLSGHTTEANMKIVEKWLAAHLASMKEQRVAMSRIGDTEFTYEGDFSFSGLRSTRYGQMAIALDPTGRIATHAHHVEVVNDGSE